MSFILKKANLLYHPGWLELEVLNGHLSGKIVEYDGERLELRSATVGWSPDSTTS